jgi:hypothetical protein
MSEHSEAARAVQGQRHEMTVAGRGDRSAADATAPDLDHVIEHVAAPPVIPTALVSYISTLEEELRTWGIPWGEVLLSSGPMLTVDERIDELRRQHGVDDEMLSGSSAPATS